MSRTLKAAFFGMLFGWTPFMARFDWTTHQPSWYLWADGVLAAWFAWNIWDITSQEARDE